MTLAATVDDAHATIENLLVTREVPVPLVPSDTQLVTLMNEAGDVFVPSEMPVSAHEFQASALDVISVMIASASDAVGVGSSIQHDGDDIQLFKPLVGMDENLDNPATIEECETLDTLQICAMPSGLIEKEPIGNFQPALSLLSPLALIPDRHHHSMINPSNCRAPWRFTVSNNVVTSTTNGKGALHQDTTPYVDSNTRPTSEGIKVTMGVRFACRSKSTVNCKTGDVEPPRCAADVQEGTLASLMVSIVVLLFQT